MCYKEWPECYKQCDNCDNLRHRDDLILVTDGAVDPDEKMICAQCASKQLSALRNEVKAWRDADARHDLTRNVMGDGHNDDVLRTMAVTNAAKALEES